MRLGYQEYVDQLVELVGIKPRTEWTGYDSWNPYRLQDPEKREPVAITTQIVTIMMKPKEYNGCRIQRYGPEVTI